MVSEVGCWLAVEPLGGLFYRRAHLFAHSRDYFLMARESARQVNIRFTCIAGAKLSETMGRLLNQYLNTACLKAIAGNIIF
jgi:hypothetical protein